MNLFTMCIEKDEEADAGLSFTILDHIELKPHQAPDGKMHQALYVGTAPQPRYAEERQVLSPRYIKVKDVKDKWKDNIVPEVDLVSEGWLMEAREGDIFHMLDTTPPKGKVEDVDEPALLFLDFTWEFGARLLNARDLVQSKTYFEAYHVCDHSYVDRDGNVNYAHARPGVLIISPNETFTISFFSPVRRQKGTADVSYDGNEIIVDNILMIAPQRRESREEGGLGDAFRKAKAKKQQDNNKDFDFKPRTFKDTPIQKMKMKDESRSGATYKPRKGRGYINPYDPRNKVNWREEDGNE